MKLHCITYDPTKNITILVDTPLDRIHYASVSRYLLHRHPHSEQVGFLESTSSSDASLRLQMMGGEFCGNATMSATAFLAEQDGLTLNESRTYCLEVSGVETLVTSRIKRLKNGFQGTVSMPLPESFRTVHLPNGQTAEAVFFPGIVHCIVPHDVLSKTEAEYMISHLCHTLGAEACGLLRYNMEEQSFTPLVYVASTDTAVWESGCGSGSAALGASLATQAGNSIRIPLRQPGGTIEVSAHWQQGKINGLTISGFVQNLGSTIEEMSII